MAQASRPSDWKATSKRFTWASSCISTDRRSGSSHCRDSRGKSTTGRSTPHVWGTSGRFISHNLTFRDNPNRLHNSSRNPIHWSSAIGAESPHNQRLRAIPPRCDSSTRPNPQPHPTTIRLDHDGISAVSTGGADVPRLAVIADPPRVFDATAARGSSCRRPAALTDCPGAAAPSLVGPRKAAPASKENIGTRQFGSTRVSRGSADQPPEHQAR